MWNSTKIWMIYLFASASLHVVFLALMSAPNVSSQTAQQLKVNLNVRAASSAATPQAASAAAKNKSRVEKKKSKDQAEVLQRNKAIVQVPPVYPSSARALGQQGRVILRVKINPKGYLDPIEVMKSSGYPMLDKAALNAVQQWQFEPTASSDWMQIPVRFVLEKE